MRQLPVIIAYRLTVGDAEALRQLAAARNMPLGPYLRRLALLHLRAKQREGEGVVTARRD